MFKVTRKYTQYEVEGPNDITYHGRGRQWEQYFEYCSLEEATDKALINALEKTVNDYENSIS